MNYLLRTIDAPSAKVLKKAKFLRYFIGKNQDGNIYYTSSQKQSGLLYMEAVGENQLNIYLSQTGILLFFLWVIGTPIAILFIYFNWDSLLEMKTTHRRSSTSGGVFHSGRRIESAFPYVAGGAAILALFPPFILLMGKSVLLKIIPKKNN